MKRNHARCAVMSAMFFFAAAPDGITGARIVPAFSFLRNFSRPEIKKYTDTVNTTTMLTIPRTENSFPQSPMQC
jgi:hypothetical protein